MNLQDILGRLDGVKGHGDQYTARCPAHADRHQSLSVSVGRDGRILLKCHAGCGIRDIAGALGLEVRDLFTEDKPQARRERPPVVATYTYPHGQQKVRRADKSFGWRRPDGKGGWIWNRQGVPNELYVAGELAGVVYAVEGEKDTNNLHKLGCNAVSGEDGAGPGKWRQEYTEQLRGLSVVVLQDNDDVGRAYAQETAAALHGVAKSVRLLDLSKVWPEIQEHGDISDMIEAKGPQEAARLLAQLVKDTPEWKPAEAPDPLMSCFMTLDNFLEEEARWLVPGWIPEGQITIMAADGGVGKTTVWCNIIAALSNGATCILDPPGYTRPPVNVMFLTTEDSVRQKLRKKLRLAGANMENIITPDFTGNIELLHRLKFGSPDMEKVIRHFRPAFCVFDPVQGFTPPKVNMGSRNEMRDCISPLISIGEEAGTTSLIVCHTNKRNGASGRDRIADSADLWDIARSVIMAGFTEEQGVRYLSNEKNNYSQLQETILFTIDGDGQPHKEGTSWKRDREYMQDADLSRSAPKREDCKAFILQMLEAAGGSMLVKEVDAKVHEAGYAVKTIRNAKEDLKKDGAVKYVQVGGNDKKVWSIQRVVTGQFVELEEDGQEDPWKEPSPSER